MRLRKKIDLNLTHKVENLNDYGSAYGIFGINEVVLRCGFMLMPRGRITPTGLNMDMEDKNNVRAVFFLCSSFF